MKRFISLLLALMMTVSLIPCVQAASGPAVSSNINDHFYINAQRWTDPIRSTLAAENGGYLRVECIDDTLVVERYDADFTFLSGQEIPLELPLYGGVFICDDYNFLLVGQNNPEEDDSVEVFRIIRYTKDWVKVDHASIYGANTTIPFDAGCPRFDRSGNILYIRTDHEMYTSSDGNNHQANVMIALRVSDMTVTDQLTKVWNSGYGYVSHSFNQFVRVDGDTLLAVDHGDAHPRSVCLFKYPYSASSETFYGRTTMVNALPIVDSTYHYNDTGVSVGGFEFSSTDYLIAGCSYDQTEPIDLMYAHRNIFVTATAKDNFTDEGTSVHWLTHFTADDGVTVSPPHLLKLDADRFFLTWTEDGVLKYCFLDGHGEIEGEIYTGSADLSDCEPILDGDRILWYVTNNSEPVFYQVGLEGGVSTPHTCQFSYAVQTAPTESAEGKLLGTCSLCGGTREVILPVLSADDYYYRVITEPGHQTTGLARYTWKVTDYGTWSFDVVLPACTHDYTAETVAPTCTAGGYTNYTCTLCGHSYVGDHTEALGHSFGDWYRTKEPGCTSAGSERRDCSRCGHTEQRTVGATGHSYESVVTEPTCTESGFTTHTCTLCGDTYTDTPTAPLGHSFGDWTVTQAPSCTVPGLESHACIRCGHTEQQTVDALGHDYTSVVTEPGCESQGYTTHTCERCSDSYVDAYVPALGHPWDEGVVIKEPTEEEPGIRRHSCPVCGATSDRVIPALDHTHQYESVVTQPTCTEPGFTTHTCACGDSYTDSHTAALGHDEVIDAGYAATCTEDGLTDGAHCGRCGLILRQQEVIPAAGHRYEAAISAPTCTEEGFTTHTCAGCGHSYTDSFVPALGHDWHGTGCTRCDEKRSNPFLDVPEDSFYIDPVLWAVENGITNGIDDTHFGPDNSCMRAHAVTFLWRAAGSPEPTATANPFVDVTEGDFFYKAVLWAVENGITNGVDATHFGPTQNCNRAQVVTFLWRSVGSPNADGSCPFTDVQPGSFYETAVLWALEKGVTNGLSATEFGINAICNRAQIVTFLYRTFAK